MNRNTDYEARVEAYLAFLRTLKTEPMTIVELSQWFNRNRNKMKTIVEAIPGVQVVGSRYRIPLSSMPPRFLIEYGFFEQCNILPHSAR